MTAFVIFSAMLVGLVLGIGVNLPLLIIILILVIFIVRQKRQFRLAWSSSFNLSSLIV